MFKRVDLKMALTCAVTALCMVRPALALNNRSWVSQSGNDANNCSIADPCKTFQHAHDETVTAGEVDVLNPGDYGALTITKSIVIDGGGMGYIGAGAITVNAAAGSTVVIRNLSMNSLGGTTANAISWVAGELLYVEGVTIENYVNGIAVGPFAASANGGRSLVIARLFVNDTTIRDCSDFGVNLQPFASFTASLNHVTIENNTSSSALTGGMLVQGTTASVKNSLISRVPNGVVVDVQGQLELDNSTISYTTLGIEAEGAGALVRIGGDSIHLNSTGMSATGGAQIVSYGNNQIAANGAGETPTSTITLK